ncbi:MAG: hypothetical protein H0T43_01325 [Solirubrobacterales bacterium]|nr:hypothetical protein [Solirubrobacterales bacterium]
MGSRSRKRRRSSDGPPPGYARGRARDEAIRAELEPLAEGERPGAVTIAAVVAFVFAIANVIAAVTGNDLSSEQGDPVFFTLVTSSILLIAGLGMLWAKYWAVLGFQVLLGLQIVVLALAVTIVEKWWLGIGIVVLIGLLGWLFWSLVRAMARIQMPDRQPPGASR